MIKKFITCEKIGRSTPCRSKVLNFGDETGIDLTPARSQREAWAWYTLDGRRLFGKPTKTGIYINNGKKVIIK